MRVHALVEAQLEFWRGALDDLLEIESVVRFEGKARLRFDVRVAHAESRKPVVRGYTVHAYTDRAGKPMRPPAWFVAKLEQAANSTGSD